MHVNDRFQVSSDTSNHIRLSYNPISYSPEFTPSDFAFSIRICLKVAFSVRICFSLPLVQSAYFSDLTPWNILHIPQTYHFESIVYLQNLTQTWHFSKLAHALSTYSFKLLHILPKKFLRPDTVKLSHIPLTWEHVNRIFCPCFINFKVISRIYSSIL